MKRAIHIIYIMCAIHALPGLSQEDSTVVGQELRSVDVRATQQRHGGGIEWNETIGKSDLIRAACCNLGESFQNSASVDVSYSDAATGVRQVKLLGLSGTYVQMLTENIPNYRGAASPYALGYVPGPWMQSIKVSKGACSVKNGYESVTGQINIEFLKPQAMEQVNANAYLDHHLKYDVNLDASRHLRANDRWSTGTLLHWENREMEHDANGDHFMDEPLRRQLHLMHRWAYISPHYIMQVSARGLWERNESGQTMHHGGSMTPPEALYRIQNKTQRYELHLKNAYIFNPEQNGNIALILSGNIHHQENTYGRYDWRHYDIHQRQLYASLMYEQDYSARHQLSAGVSLQGDWYDEDMLATGMLQPIRNEVVPGVYVQYTFCPSPRLTLMGGLRVDHSNLAGTFVTPRAHLRWQPTDELTWRISVGKGYRTTRPLLEYHYLLAASRHIDIDEHLPQEEAWNTGSSLQGHFPIGKRQVEWSIDYYYTHFLSQVVMDRDSDPHRIHFTGLNGRSFSHALQAEITVSPADALSLTAAWRMNQARQTIGGILRELPLTSRYKGLLSASLKPGLGLWQVDVTCQLNGPGRLPDPYPTAAGQWSWKREYHAFPQLSAQITRHLMHWDVYVGGENLANLRQHHPIVDAVDPWGSHFDSAIVWGPITGAMAYVGFRWHWEPIIK